LNLGLVVGRAKFNIFGVRTEELIEDRPKLAAVIRPLLAARKAIEEQIGDLDRKVLKLASRLRQGSPTDRSGQPCRPVVTCLSECPASVINQLTPIRAPRLLTGLELSRRM
jgi:hypothetical protein